MTSPGQPEMPRFPPFQERWPWRGSILQSIAFNYLARNVDLDPHEQQRIEVQVPDGSGDRLVHHLDLPASADADERETPTKPLVILFHGLGGHSEEGYIRLAARYLLEQGHPVLRFNNRGCGIGRDHACQAHWPKDTVVIHATLDYLRHARPELLTAGVALIAFSLGATLLTSWLAEAGETTDPVFAAVTISAAIDLAEASKNVGSWRMWPFCRYLMRKMKHQMQRPMLQATPAERQAISQARTLWQFDETFTAPRHGFESAEAFYDACHFRHLLPRVRVPVLMLVSRDDPFVPFGAYDRFDFDRNHRITLHFNDRGGHSGFHGVGNATPWCDRIALQFLMHHALTDSDSSSRPDA